MLKSDGMDDMRENIWSNTEVCQRGSTCYFMQERARRKFGSGMPAGKKLKIDSLRKIDIWPFVFIDGDPL